MRLRQRQLWKYACFCVFLWSSLTLLRQALPATDDDDFSLQLENYEISGSSGCETSGNRSRRRVDWLPGELQAQQIQEWKRMQGELSEWRNEVTAYCSGNVMMLPTSGFARLRKVIFDPDRASGRLGGEDVSQVMNQSESAEYWNLQPGAFQVLCPSSILGWGLARIVGPLRRTKPHKTIQQYLESSLAVDWGQFSELSVNAEPQLGPVLAVTRIEYANLYHTVSHLYNVFANAVFFGINPSDATVLIIDGHPRGALDPIWSTLFRQVLRIGELIRPTALRDVVWVAEGHESPVLLNQPSLPLIDEFRQFFLSRHGIARHLDAVPRVCTGNRVVFIRRKDYLAHPRNLNGQVSRKIANEDEVLMEIQSALPHLKLNVTAVAMENLTFREQLQLISQARILIGMHGAGLTHAMFLPRGSGLIELFPDLWTQRNNHFRSIAMWRDLEYQSWVGSVKDNRLPVQVPTGVTTILMRRMAQSLRCL